MHPPADAKNALTKPLALISFCYCFVSRLAQGRFYRDFQNFYEAVHGRSSTEEEWLQYTAGNA